jgi:cell wall-associated NlpC family hydrolase
MSATKYTPRHRALKHRAVANWKRLTALGATVPAAIGTASALGAPAQAAGQREQKIEHAVAVARNQKADEYEYGADGPERFDCSGLMQYVYGQAGISLPRTSDAQADKGRRIDRSQLRPGDLIAFTDGGDVYHVAMYTGRTRKGDFRIIEAANEQTEVHSAPVWDNSWYGVTFRNS